MHLIQEFSDTLTNDPSVHRQQTIFPTPLSVAFVSGSRWADTGFSSPLAVAIAQGLKYLIIKYLSIFMNDHF